MGLAAPMRRFLYISPSFPPTTSVGALRPLKFARHLPAFGWAPVVLADLYEGDGMSAALDAAVPSSTTVIRDYSRHAALSESRFRAGALPLRAVDAGGKPIAPTTGWRRLIPRALRNEYRSRSFWFPDQRLLPMSHNVVDIPHATRAIRRALDAHPECEAVVVNAGPEAAIVAARRVAAERDLPLVCDLRDPWALDTLKLRGMSALQQRWVRWMERRFVESSAKFILNSETALNDYRAHYADVRADRFACIRNHGDNDLIDNGQAPARDRYSILFLGNFRKYVEGDVIVEALAELKERGIGGDEVRFVITGKVTGRALSLAQELGVDDLFESAPFVPYTEIGPFMRSMDLLVALSNDSKQRIPAKIYDYLTTPLPIVVIADNPEINSMLDGVAGTTLCRLRDASVVASAFQAGVRAGRGKTYERDTKFDSRTASEKLAAILDEVTQTAR